MKTEELEAKSEAQGARPPGDWFAEALRGFGPVGLLTIAIILLAGVFISAGLSALLVVAWAWRSRTPWREIGYAQPKSWMRTIMGGMVFGASLKLLMKAVVMPLLGADPINHAFHYLAGNRAALPAMLATVIVGAGWGEETFFRGYSFERLGKLLGSSAWSKAAIVVLTALWFGASHYSVQGLAGAEQAAMVGLVFGTTLAVTGRIVMLMVAHASFDVTAVTIIYLNLESKVAHLLFR